MAFFDDILNKTSDFNCEVECEKIEFCGILQKENGNIILNAKFSLEQYEKMKSGTGFVVSGNVSGKKVTLIGCSNKEAPYSMDNNCMSIHIVPSEIIVGDCYSSPPMAKSITVTTEELNYMFDGNSPLEPIFDFSIETPSVLNYTFPKPIVARDKCGEIQLYQSFGVLCSANGYNYNIFSVIRYSFDVPFSVMDAVAKVSVARSLFAFFGNGFIPWGEITFICDDDNTECSLWLNYEEDVPAVNMPFLIRTSVFENQFQEIWRSWLSLYERAKPISTLFYEIVCNRSTRVNGFLNLSQAIEVYSNVFRIKEVNEIAKNDLKNTSKGKQPKLIHRYQDILSTYKSALELKEPDITDCAKALTNMRNYYTHYNAVNYVEPTYDELFSAIHILRFALLTIIYTAVGIPLESILECKKRVVFREFDNDIEIILNYSRKSVRISLRGTTSPPLMPLSAETDE